MAKQPKAADVWLMRVFLFFGTVAAFIAVSKVHVVPHISAGALIPFLATLYFPITGVLAITGHMTFSECIRLPLAIVASLVCWGALWINGAHYLDSQILVFVAMIAGGISWSMIAVRGKGMT